jgi:hypothetical protein
MGRHPAAAQLGSSLSAVFFEPLTGLEGNDSGGAVRPGFEQAFVPLCGAHTGWDRRGFRAGAIAEALAEDWGRSGRSDREPEGNTIGPRGPLRSPRAFVALPA